LARGSRKRPVSAGRRDGVMEREGAPSAGGVATHSHICLVITHQDHGNGRHGIGVLAEGFGRQRLVSRFRAREAEGKVHACVFIFFCLINTAVCVLASCEPHHGEGEKKLKQISLQRPNRSRAPCQICSPMRVRKTLFDSAHVAGGAGAKMSQGPLACGETAVQQR
jgi:hypothetical protein